MHLLYQAKYITDGSKNIYKTCRKLSKKKNVIKTTLEGVVIMLDNIISNEEYEITLLKCNNA